VSSIQTRDQAERDILHVLPDCAARLDRLRILAQAGLPPTVTVMGKYNHGKSRLLNELMGRDEFAVADRRQTVALADLVHGGVRWLDAPGLGADIGSGDDRHAMRAAWLESDIRLFVHAAREGELDGDERALLDELRADGEQSLRQTLFVLSQVDQLADEGQLAKIAGALGMQAPGIQWTAVSSTRHRQGMEGGKKVLLEKSGIPALKSLLEAALAHVPQARAHETALLFGQVRQALRQLLAARTEALSALRRTQAQQRQDFDRGLAAVLGKVVADLLMVVDAPVEDHALTPDRAADAYRLTAGKVERARIQIAYSRACMEIDGFLAGHGVIGLPSGRQAGAGSLNTVMVAVLGVSVKHRNDLRGIFCSPPGRERLQREFTAYYEQSADRLALAKQVLQAESDVSALQKALAALQALEAGA